MIRTCKVELFKFMTSNGSSIIVAWDILNGFVEKMSQIKSLHRAVRVLLLIIRSLLAY